MTAKRAEDIQGYEYDWLACDEHGYVAMFSTAGGGYAPKEFLAATDRYDEALDLLKSGGAITSASIAPHVAEGLPNTWKDLAERGIFSYDSDVTGRPYHLVGAPTTPVHIDELHPLVAGVVKRIVLRGVRLGQQARILREDIVRSESD